LVHLGERQWTFLDDRVQRAGDAASSGSREKLSEYSREIKQTDLLGSGQLPFLCHPLGRL
jgi:hypothetical protein